ncbi:hypothetical protein ABI59_00335 [Acidobacteria bacterium Mor1]|nr:hypothetical protein ABI59_00335 [Acidobacteria bacterium Mor1]
MVLTIGGAGLAAEKLAPESVIVRNATIWTQGPQGIVENADLLVRDGKIQQVGSGLKAPRGAHVIEAAGKFVTPGLIDAHSHTALRGGVNEGSDNITSEVRIADVINPADINLYRQLAGGLTVAHSLHGSANSIGGQDAVIKLRWGARADELLIPTAKPGIKFALGENPKRSNFRSPQVPQRYPNTRMGVMESIRGSFLAARQYMQEWERYQGLSSSDREREVPPRRDLRLEAIAEILRGERIIHSHSYRQDEILALIRVAEEFGVTVGTFQHVLEGYKIADELAAHGAGASTFSDWWAFKLEAFDAIPFNGALMYDRGVSVTFNSDSSELARRMNLEAAKAVKYGNVPPEAALAFVTLNAADQLGIGDRTGSLEPGKDADFVIWSHPPLSVYAVAEETWVDGVREFSRAEDLAGRAAVAEERAKLIAEITGKEDKAEDASAATAKPLFRQQAAGYRDRLASHGGTVSITGATVHTMTGAPIQNGTVSFRAGEIVEVGAGLAPLPGAEVIDATGKHLYPGFIDANNVVGLTEIGSVSGSVDISEQGELNPNANTAIAINPDSELIPVTRANGLTHAISAPGGGLVSGTSSLIRMDGWTWEDHLAAGPVAMHLRWPSFTIRTRSRFGRSTSRGDQIKRRDERLERIATFFDDARAYRRAKEGAGGRDFDIEPRFEAMLPVLGGATPVVIHASEIRQIKSALDWAAGEEGLRVILAGAGDVWRVADRLAAHDVPVILTSVLSLPRREDEPYDTPFTTPSKLREAGVRFCIAGSGSGFGASNARNLPYQAAMAAAFGLDRDEALRALSLYPAQILGVGDALGSIEVGKSASLFLSDGDPLEITTSIERMFIDGREADLPGNKHERLYRRYSERPKAAGAGR